MAATVLDPEEARQHVIIDGVAGHLIPITEAKKIKDIKNAQGQEVAVFMDQGGVALKEQEVADLKEPPPFFEVRLSDTDIRTYKVLKTEVSPSGFKSVAYCEVNSDTLKPDNEFELRLSFQGFVEGKGDRDTAWKVFRGKETTHIEETERFTREAIDAARCEGNISALISGSHSYGAMNAIEADRVAQECNIATKIVLLETSGARKALEDCARRRAEKKFGTQAIDHTVIDGIVSDTEKRITSVNSDPPSIVTSHSSGEAVGTEYALNVRSEASDGIMGLIARHRLGAMMQACLHGVQPTRVDASSSELRRALERGGGERDSADVALDPAEVAARTKDVAAEKGATVGNTDDLGTVEPQPGGIGRLAIIRNLFRGGR